MTDARQVTAPLADLNLVLAVIKEEDALKARAMRYVAARPRPVAPVSVGIELLLWCRKHRLAYVDWMDRAIERFDVENAEVLQIAAQALKEGRVRSPFDAVHLAEALHRGVPLATADEALWTSGFPTARF